ncbi:MAG: hypothetical protein ACXWOT_11710 [Candidatus Limnocylindrales bacterium]
MSDRHLRVLRDIVRHRVEMLDRHSPRPGETSAQSGLRRQDLVLLSARARTRLAAAEVRRRVVRDRG